MARDIFIPDIHGDPDALKRTLLQAGLAEGTVENYTIRNPGDIDQVVFTGDYIDRGPDNLGALNLLLDVRSEFQNVVFEPGNHDLTALHVLTHPKEPQWMRLWSDGIPVLHQVAQQYKLLRESPAIDIHPLANYQLPDDEVTDEFQTFWKQYMEKNPDMQFTDFPAAYQKLHELFFEGPFKILFEQMKMAHRIGEIVAVHAGMNEMSLKLGVEKLNELYRIAWQRKDFRFLFDYDWKKRQKVAKAPLAPLVAMMKPLPPSDTPLITEKTAEKMFDQRMLVMIHGHAVLIGKDIPRRCVQQCNNAFGKVADMNGDIGMSSGFLTGVPDKTSDWGYIDYDTETGKFTANNPTSGPLDFGQLRNGEYVFPDQ